MRRRKCAPRFGKSSRPSIPRDELLTRLSSDSRHHLYVSSGRRDIPRDGTQCTESSHHGTQRVWFVRDPASAVCSGTRCSHNIFSSGRSYNLFYMALNSEPTTHGGTTRVLYGTRPQRLLRRFFYGAQRLPKRPVVVQLSHQSLLSTEY